MAVGHRALPRTCSAAEAELAPRGAAQQAGLTGDSMDSMGIPLMSLRFSAAACRWAVCLMTWYTARCMTHSLQSVVAFTVAARGAEYSSASSPKPLQNRPLVSPCAAWPQARARPQAVLHELIC